MAALEVPGLVRATPLDAFAILAAASHFRWGGIETYVQKALYCAEDDAVRGGQPVVLTFPFFRWKHGPYSKEIANVAESLARSGFMSSKRGPLAPRGHRLVDEIRTLLPHFPHAAAALKTVDAYAARFAGMALRETLREVYARPAHSIFGPTTVANVPEGEDMIEADLDAAVARELEELFGLIEWRLSQSEQDELAEKTSPLVSADRADAFTARYLP